MKLRKKSTWSFQEISCAGIFVALWMTLSVFSVPLKILMHEGYLPIFYFLIWIVGLLFSPPKAFLITIIGHFTFDLIYLPNPLFIFVWLASGFFSATIALLRNQNQWWKLLYVLPPIFYLIAFFIMGYIQFDEPFKYFGVNFGVTLVLLIVNPIFNFFVITIFRNRPRFINFLIDNFASKPTNTLIKNNPQPNNHHSTIHQREIWQSHQKQVLGKYLFSAFGIIVIWVGTILGIYYFPINNKNPSVFVVISSKTGYTDKSFNQESINGACQYYKIAIQQCNINNAKFRQNIAYGFPNTVINGQKIFQFIKQTHRTKKTDIFVLTGFTFTNFLNHYIQKLQAKKINLISITTNYQPKSNNAWPSNLYQYQFQEQKAGFMAGLYAALYALFNPDQFKDGNLQKPGKQIKFSSLGLILVPAILAFGLGFKAAIDYVDQNKKLFWSTAKKLNIPLPDKTTFDQIDLYHQNFEIIGGTDFNQKNAEASQLAKKLYKTGTSVIFSIAGMFTVSINNQAKIENFRSEKKQNWVVGVDVDQGFSLFNQKGWQSQDQILTSAIINVRGVVTQAIKQIRQNNPMSNTEIIKDLQFFQIPNRYRNLANPLWKIWMQNRNLLENKQYIKQMSDQIDVLIKQKNWNLAIQKLRNPVKWKN